MVFRLVLVEVVRLRIAEYRFVGLVGLILYDSRTAGGSARRTHTTTFEPEDSVTLNLWRLSSFSRAISASDWSLESSTRGLDQRAKHSPSRRTSLPVKPNGNLVSCNDRLQPEIIDSVSDSGGLVAAV